jgi:dTDP-4-dehydrorhamnose reductase
MINKKKVLIIGATGLLGSALLEVGKKKGFEVFGTYHITKPREQNENMFQLSADDLEITYKIISLLKPDYIIDTHAIINVDYCEEHKEEAWKSNVIGVKNIVDSASKIGAKVIFISTDYVFDGYGPADESEKLLNIDIKPYKEEDKRKPLNFYGLTKAIAEDYVLFSNENNLVIRTSAIYGAQGSTGKTSFVQFIKSNLEEGKETKVVIDQWLSPTNNYLLSEAILKLISKEKSGIYHVCGEPISKYDWAIMIAKRLNLNVDLIKPIKTKELKQVAKRPFKPILSKEKFIKEIGNVKLTDFYKK